MKKGAAQIWWIIATAIIAMIVVIFIITWFQGGGSRLFSGLEDKTQGLKDQDKDNFADLFDKCPCDPNIGDTFPEGVTECKVKCT